jgi:polyisoprenoid-binding protein YceI
MRKIISLLVFYSILGCSNQDKLATNDQNEGNPVMNPDFMKMVGKDFLIDDQHSYIGFRIKYFGNSNVRGRFDKFKGTAFYDTLNKFISTTINIDVTSINTGDKRRDDDVKQGAWFETSKFPTASFTSIGTFLNAKGLALKGVLKIKNVSKEIILQMNKPTQLTKDWAGNDQVDFIGEFILNRKDFNIEGEGFWNEVMENGITQLSDEVFVEIEIHARRADYSIRKTKANLIDSIALILWKESELKGFERVVTTMFNNHSNETQKIDRTTLYDFGNILINEGKYEDAIQVFKMLSQLYPEKLSDLNLLGTCYLLNGDIQQAKIIFSKVISADSLNTKAFEYLRNIQ